MTPQYYQTLKEKRILSNIIILKKGLEFKLSQVIGKTFCFVPEGFLIDRFTVKKIIFTKISPGYFSNHWV